MKPISFLSPLVALLSIIFVSGCGKSDPSSAAASAPAATAPAAAKSAPAEGRAVAITAGDSMKFDLTEIRAKPGEALAVTLKNTGTVPKFSMGHNWVLLTTGVDVNEFSEATGQAAKTDYVPASFKDRILASTKLLGPGESDTARFYAPSKPGHYVFLCSFPGHVQVGMRGDLIVE